MDRNYHVTTLFQNADILRRPGVAKFADIAKIVIKLTRKIKVRRITSYVLKLNFYLFLPDITKTANFLRKMLISAELKGCFK